MTLVQLISSDRKRAGRLVDLLDPLGFDVRTGLANDLLRQELFEHPPQAVLFDIDRAPATCRDLGLSLRINPATRGSLLVYLGGTTERVREIRRLLPDAVFTSEANLVEDLKRSLANPPAQPIIPESVFAGYSGRPLAAKLGIKPGMQVRLIDAPPGLNDLLTPLPAGVVLGYEGGSPNITLWFVTRRDALISELPPVLKGCGEGKLWVAWPKKSSGYPTELTQAEVRSIGLKAGWVDFKICAVDATWSALCFTKRKEG